MTTSHIQLALNVADIEAATTFYAGMFGVQPAKQRPGYANFVDASGNFKPWYNGADSLVSQAERQLEAAAGTPVTWHVAEQEAATAIENLFAENGITGINIIFTPPL